MSWEPFKLQAIVAPAVEIAARSVLVSGVVENTQRVGLGPLDEAYAVQRLKADGMSQAAIARTMAVSQATVTQRLKLLELPAMAQKRVNAGEQSVYSALTALGLPEGGERDAAVKALTRQVVTLGLRKMPVEEAGDGGEGEVAPACPAHPAHPACPAHPARPKTAKKMLAELEKYATPDGDGERTRAQVWLLTELIPWAGSSRRGFRGAMEALEKL